MEPEPSSEPQLERPGLHTKYSRMGPQRDLDSGLNVTYNNAGIACASSGNRVLFGCKDTGIFGREQFVVDLKGIRERIVWQTQVDVVLHAFWYLARIDDGRAVVTVEVVDEYGLRSEKQETDIFPVDRINVESGFSVFSSLGQWYNKVGRVRVEVDPNGLFRATLAIY